MGYPILNIGLYKTIIRLFLSAENYDYYNIKIC